MLATTEQDVTPTGTVCEDGIPFLLLTGTAPGEPGVGGVILRDLLAVAGAENCRCCWLAPRNGRQAPYMSEVMTTVHPRRFEVGFRPVRGVVGEFISAIALRVLRPHMVQKICAGVERLVRTDRPRFLLAVLESPAAIQVALEVHRRTGLPVRSIVWDDVETFCRQGMYDRWTRSWIQGSFEAVLRASERVAVICENMQSAYQQEIGIESFVLRHGIASISDRSLHRKAIKRDYDVIGFAGSITAPDCFESLLQALDSVNWRLNDRDVVLRLLGVRHLLDSRRPQRIEYFGWRSVEETRELLADCDLLYLPQSFLPELKRFSKLSFPTKLSTYAAARQPIVLHAPDYGSLSGFWRLHELGPHCASHRSEQILITLGQALADDSNRRIDWLSQIDTVNAQVLSSERFAQGVHRLID